MHKRMFKVLAFIERHDGAGQYTMRLGTGFTNKDESINVHLDAIPVGQKELKLHLREITEEDLRESAAKRAAYSSRTPPPNLGPSSNANDLPL